MILMIWYIKLIILEMDDEHDTNENKECLVKRER